MRPTLPYYPNQIYSNKKNTANQCPHEHRPKLFNEILAIRDICKKDTTSKPNAVYLSNLKMVQKIINVIHHIYRLKGNPYDYPNRRLKPSDRSYHPFQTKTFI